MKGKLKENSNIIQIIIIVIITIARIAADI